MVRGARGDDNPGTAGLHFGMQNQGDTANLALSATSALFFSRMDFTFAGQTSSPTLRIQVNHARSLATLLLNDPLVGGFAISMTSKGANFGPDTLSPLGALQVTGALATGIPTTAGVHIGMTSNLGAN